MLGRQTHNVDFPWYARRFIRNIAQNATRTLVQAQRAARSDVDEAPLFVADTRPAMFFGVPHVMSVLLIWAFAESIIFLGPLWCWWVLIPWVAAMNVVRKDYNMPRVLLLWLQTKAIAFDSSTWYGASPSAFPLRAARYPRGIW